MDTQSIERDAWRDALAGEMADVRASIALVASGTARSVTLTSLRFGREIAERLAGLARGAGVTLELDAWDEARPCRITVTGALGNRAA
jgi:hypothetical protein